MDRNYNKRKRRHVDKHLFKPGNFDESSESKNKKKKLSCQTPSPLDSPSVRTYVS